MKKQGFRLRLLPVIFFTAVVFLIVRAHSYNIDIEVMENIPINSSMELWDVFSYVKSSLILFAAIWAGVNMFFLLVTEQMVIKKTYIYIPMIIYTAFVVLSCILSDYRGVAWAGGLERFEGTRTILCYMFMLFYTINVVDDIRDAITIILPTMVGVFVACLIGLTQLVGHDFFLTSLGKWLVAGSDLEVSGAFEKGQVYQTVSNMNYVGMYLVLLVPMLIFVIYYLCKMDNRQALRLAGIEDNKRKAIIALAGLLLVMIALNVYGADSLGGVLGIFCAVVVLVALLLKKKWQKITLIAISLAGIMIFGVIYYIGWSDNHKKIDYFETGIDYVKISLNGKELNFRYDFDNNDYQVWDGDGNRLNAFCIEGQEGTYQIDDDRYRGEITGTQAQDGDGNPCIMIDVKDLDLNKKFIFTFYPDDAKYLNPFGQEVSLRKIKSFGFENHLMMGNGRGYIWSRTIPLLNNSLIVGTGADTFMFVFPQGDYAGKYSSNAHLDAICDKAHNMYLQMFVGTGLISLLSFLTIVGMALWRAFCQKEENHLVKVIAAGIIGFLFAGISNDSGVSIMPVFYGMLGIVIGLGI